MIREEEFVRHDGTRGNGAKGKGFFLKLNDRGVGKLGIGELRKVIHHQCCDVHRLHCLLLVVGVQLELVADKAPVVHGRTIKIHMDA